MTNHDHLVLLALRRVLMDDEAGDGIRPLGEYLSRFPGFEDAVSREYREYVRDTALPDNGRLSNKLEPGTAFGPYELERRLGQGGQGDVYLARDTRFNRKIALKILTTEASRTFDHAHRRFAREIEITSLLEHPNICTLYDAGEANGRNYIAMRYVSGETLARVICRRLEDSPGTTRTRTTSRDKDLETATSPRKLNDVDTICHIVEKIARAAHAAHELGIIHRDIKPANIMIDRLGEPILLDFGFAKATNGDMTTITENKHGVGGTAPYMSPEQVSANALRLDRRSDIWSIGVVLFESLTTERPFDRDTTASTLDAIQSAPIPNIVTRNPTIGRDLQIVVEVALQKNREDRYATAADFADDLERIRNREPIHARRPNLGNAWHSMGPEEP